MLQPDSKNWKDMLQPDSKNWKDMPQPDSKDSPGADINPGARHVLDYISCCFHHLYLTTRYVCQTDKIVATGEQFHLS